VGADIEVAARWELPLIVSFAQTKYHQSRFGMSAPVDAAVPLGRSLRSSLPFGDSGFARPVSVCLLISSLEYGGAERQVVEMFRTFDRSRVRPIICSLSSNVPLAAGLDEHREDLYIVPRRWRFDFTTIFRVARLLRRERIDVLHAFLFDAEIIGRLAAPLAGVPVVIASERNADYTRPSLHECALRLTQPLVDTLVTNSFAGKQFTLRTTRFKDSQLHVVHNGVDTIRFRPDREAGATFRRRHGIPADALVVGMVGNYKRQKGHDVFLRMAAQVISHFDKTVFLIGGAPTGGRLAPSRAYQKEIEALAAQLGLRHRCHFVENEQNMPGLYNACDVTVLLSRREGTPNVLLESMACGIPIVATRVADNVHIVGETGCGFLVPVNDALAAAEAVRILLEETEAKTSRSAAARQCASEFSLERAARKLEQIYCVAAARA
jgi:glycosyltransferase involved in cell wall biosynthesis